MNPGAWAAEAGNTRVQDQPGLHSTFQTSLRCRGLRSLREQTKQQSLLGFPVCVCVRTRQTQGGVLWAQNALMTDVLGRTREEMVVGTSGVHHPSCGFRSLPSHFPANSEPCLRPCVQMEFYPPHLLIKWSSADQRRLSHRHCQSHRPDQMCAQGQAQPTPGL